ncbi:MAG: tol-pal system-associated acyl-CoA thioesterase [Saccharospirillaceae bacterium]|nr:tol-pal system-associated acyl-CoA thioesterase [Saccharospirillaceae bacterium]MCD8531421.1 tol-pal system-associated acyl-CoA thioesterase [Saccharospirillaceae bacterium]
MAFTWPLRVYIEDTDAGGIVYYANYFRFMERARSEWLRALGYGQEQLRHQNVIFVVREVQAKYLSPARLDDELLVSVAVEQSRKASLLLSQKVWRKPAEERPDAAGPQDYLAEALITIACITQTGRPQAVPAEILKRMTAGAAYPSEPNDESQEPL